MVTVVRRAWLLLATTLAIGGASPGMVSTAHAQGLSDCAGRADWPQEGFDLRGVTFLGHVIPDRFGALRLAVDRVFDDHVPSEVVVIRSCLPSEALSGEVLISAAANLVDASGDEPGDLRLWLTRSGGAIWRVQSTGRLALVGTDDPDRRAPDAWFGRLRFVSEVVTAVMGEDTPPDSAYDDSSDALPPLRAPTQQAPHGVRSSRDHS